MMKQESNRNRKRYVLRQDFFTPSWVRQEVQVKFIAATQAQMGSTVKQKSNRKRHLQLHDISTTADKTSVTVNKV